MNGEAWIMPDDLPHEVVRELQPVPFRTKVFEPSHKQQRIEFLERHRITIQQHMRTRMEDGDWHGVSDDANDLREVDAELNGLRFS